jgi:hypothetical protein
VPGIGYRATTIISSVATLRSYQSHTKGALAASEGSKITYTQMQKLFTLEVVGLESRSMEKVKYRKDPFIPERVSSSSEAKSGAHHLSDIQP